MKNTSTLFACTLAALSFTAIPGKSEETAKNTETVTAPEPAKKAAPAKAAEKTVIDYLSDKLVDANGKKIAPEALKGKTVGIYFSAEWCPPCKQFTPLLVDFRNKNKDAFEVVFVSSDSSEAEKKDYMLKEKMKWPTLAGVESPAGGMLSQAFQIQGIPTLIIITPDGTPLTPNGREHVTMDPKGALKMWQDAAAKIPTS